MTRGERPAGGDVEALFPELRELYDQFDRIREDAERLAQTLSEGQANWRPGPGRWSVAECLAHLNETADCYLAAIDRGLDRGEARNLTGKGPFRYRWFGRWFVRQLEPPPKRAFKAPAMFAPRSDLGLADVAQRFLAAQAHLQARLLRANGLHLARIKVTSPVSRWIRFELGQCFNVVASHERRHLWQAHQVVESPGFPGEA